MYKELYFFLLKLLLYLIFESPGNLLLFSFNMLYLNNILKENNNFTSFFLKKQNILMCHNFFRKLMLKLYRCVILNCTFFREFNIKMSSRNILILLNFKKKNNRFLYLKDIKINYNIMVRTGTPNFISKLNHKTNTTYVRSEKV